MEVRESWRHEPTRSRSRIAAELEAIQPGGSADVAEAVRRGAGHWQRRGLVVLIGDFLDDEQSLPAARELRGRRQEILVCQVLHGDELSFPFEGMTLFRGLESLAELESDPRSLRNAYLDALEKFLAASRSACLRAGVDHLLVDMRERLDIVLTRYLGFRHGRG